MDTPLRLAIDLDDTIMDTHNVKPGYKLGVPIDGAFEALWELKNQGALIVVHTVWGDTEAKVKAISEWMNYFKLPYDFITNKKPVCDVYLDDKAIRFSNWEQALRDIKTGTGTYAPERPR